MEDRSFIDKIVNLQRHRQIRMAAPETEAVFFDRSPVCTLALSRYLGFVASRHLAEEIDRICGGVYAPTVFFIRNLGFIHPTAARQISFEEALVFERLHEQTYQELGFQLVDVPPCPVIERAKLVRQTVMRLK